MQILVEFALPDIAASSVNLTNSPVGSSTWVVVDHVLTRTCPVSGAVHDVEADVTYTVNNFDFSIDRVTLGMGLPGSATVVIGPVPITFVTETADGPNTILRSGRVIIPNEPATRRIAGGTVLFTVFEMPAPYIRNVTIARRLFFTGWAVGTRVVIYEDVDGEAGDYVGAATTDSVGVIYLQLLMPPRDLVILAGSTYILLPAGTADITVTKEEDISEQTLVSVFPELSGAPAPRTPWLSSAFSNVRIPTLREFFGPMPEEP